MKNENALSVKISRLDIVQSVKSHDIEMVLSYGAEISDEVGHQQNGLLRSLSATNVDETHSVLGDLANIIKELSPEKVETEVKKKNKLFDRFLPKKKKSENEIFNLTDKVNDIETTILKYRQNLVSNHSDLVELYNIQIKQLKALEHYVEEANEAIKVLKEEAVLEDDLIQLNDRNSVIARLEGRVIEMQGQIEVIKQNIISLPTIRDQQFAIIEKLNSTLIVVIPTFKNSLSAKLLLRGNQKINEGLDAVRSETEKLLKNNAIELNRISGEVKNDKLLLSTESYQEIWTNIESAVQTIRNMELTNLSEKKRVLEGIKKIVPESKKNLTLLESESRI